MSKQLRNRHFVLFDLFLLTVASYMAYVLRLERFNLAGFRSGFLLFTILAIVTTLISFRLYGVYARYWRYASVPELVLLVKGIMVATSIAGIFGALAPRFATGTVVVPLSIPFIFALLAITLTAGPRLAVRLAAHPRQRDTDRWRNFPVLIVGAGDAGAVVVRELQHHRRELGMEVIGFVDDDPRKRHMHIHGVPVLGDRTVIPEVVGKYRLRQVIIAMPKVPGVVIREFVRICEQAGVKAQIIPSIHELIDGTVSVKQLREVKIEDLLRRVPVQTNTDEIRLLTQGKRVLVTGGGGSIGSELCRQIAQFKPAQLLLAGHGENSLFHIETELRRRFPDLNLSAIVVDVRDRTRLDYMYKQYRPEIVFHAAAHKHVPLMEANPCEAITNNVVGTRNLVELADKHDVSHFVLISSDKAVNPTNVMGASKRCAEQIVLKVARESRRPYVAVRFGNVLGSRGSVVPFFKQQIAAGGPVTITHPDMRRYFMTIPEAVQLVLQAAAIGKWGEVFVLDMGEPVRIVDLAQDLIQLSGLRPGVDIEIAFTGLRPGEKLFEELFIEGETYQKTQHEKIFVVQSATQAESDPSRERNMEWLIDAALRNDDEAIRPLLQLVVPKYQPTAAGQELVQM